VRIKHRLQKHQEVDLSKISEELKKCNSIRDKVVLVMLNWLHTAHKHIF